jgi:branched-chain amino acid transport system substrate-binding protein
MKAYILMLVLMTACVQDAQPIKIGVLQPLTGPTAFIGERIKNGVMLAYDELPQEEKNKIQLIFEDDACNGKQAITAAQKLIEVDTIDYLIGPTCNAAAVSVLQKFTSANIVTLTTGVITEGLATSGGTNHYTLQPRIKDLMYKLADHVYETGARKVSILYLNDEFGLESAKHFEQRFMNNGGKILTKELFAPTETDYRTSINKLKQQPNDAVFMMSYGPFLINQLKQMKELGYKPKMYGPVPVEDANLIKAAGTLADGIVYPYPADNVKNSEQAKFERKYMLKHGIAPDIYPSIAYDTFKVLLTAIKECDDNECVQNRLMVKNYRGAGGTINLDSEGIGVRNIVIKQIRNGTFTTT